MRAARPGLQPKARRWLTNWAVAALDSLVVRLLFPAAAVGAALDAQAQGWGLFPMLGAPGWLAFILSVALLDLAIWAQHLVFHKVPVLWRLHRVHHAAAVRPIASPDARRPLHDRPRSRAEC